jgi:sulfur carrier protein
MEHDAHAVLMETSMLELIVNGSAATMSPGATLSDLLATLGLGEARVAVELNNCIIPRSEHGRQLLKNGDKIEIVHAIGGG